MKKSLADYMSAAKSEDKAEKSEDKPKAEFSEMRLLRLAERVFEPSYDSEKSRSEQLMDRVEALKLLIAACK